jgi:PPOX class probable F420-dependent enzyme
MDPAHARGLTFEVRALVEAPNYAHLATVAKDGSPRSVAVWVGLEGDHILIGAGQDSMKAQTTRRDPRVAISIADRENPYRSAMILGRVIAQRPDEDGTVMNTIAFKYSGAPYPYNGAGRKVLVIEVDRALFVDLPFAHQPGVTISDD